MRILMVGDVIGRPGRRAARALLPGLRQEYAIDLIIANGENAAGGIGITTQTADELFESDVDVITSGNHIWAQREIIPTLDSSPAILRPLNYPQGVPGHGYVIKGEAMVVNLIGRTFIGNFDCPFRAIDQLLEDLADKKPPVIIVDFHAEATSEKVAMGWYLDGRVSAVLGTHTHVGTVDARLLPKGTAHITDVGMTGPLDSVIGDDVNTVLTRFLTQLPYRISVGKGSVILNSVLVEIEETTGRAKHIKRIDREFE
ncbi:MAG: TIGR00282 family metallophosphoesterase [Dehalococcoidia bacterium]|nr:TIGR00282 family metallophosphoesterase [Dehalococcoidia bacterium]